MNKKTHHTVTIQEMQDACNGLNVEVAGSYGDGSHKSLKIGMRDGKVTFKVSEAKALIAETSDINIAVNSYNNLP